MAAKGSLSGTVLKTSGSLLYMSAAPCEIPQWGTADAEFKVPSIENPELAHIISLKPGVGPNIATHVSPTASISSMFDFLPFRSIRLLCFKSSPYFSVTLVLADTVFPYGPADENSSPCSRTQNDLSGFSWWMPAE